MRKRQDKRQSVILSPKLRITLPRKIKSTCNGCQVLKTYHRKRSYKNKLV